MSKTHTSKAKGRKGQQEIRDKLLTLYPMLEPDDIKSTSMGASGEDLMLSPAARRIMPWSVEVKRRKTMAIARYMEQADGQNEHEPIVFMREDRGKWLVCVDADYFLNTYWGMHDE